VKIIFLFTVFPWETEFFLCFRRLGIKVWMSCVKCGRTRCAASLSTNMELFLIPMLSYMCCYKTVLCACTGELNTVVLLAEVDILDIELHHNILHSHYFIHSFKMYRNFRLESLITCQIFTVTLERQECVCIYTGEPLSMLIVQCSC
jgi:hypothetical protein